MHVPAASTLQIRCRIACAFCIRNTVGPTAGAAILNAAVADRNAAATRSSGRSCIGRCPYLGSGARIPLHSRLLLMTSEVTIVGRDAELFVKKLAAHFSDLRIHGAAGTSEALGVCAPSDVLLIRTDEIRA